MSRFPDAAHALADAWASIDGKLDQFRTANTDESGHREGYLTEAEEMIERLERRGYTVVKLGHPVKVIVISPPANPPGEEP